MAPRHATRSDPARALPSFTINFGFDKVSRFASALALLSFITGH